MLLLERSKMICDPKFENNLSNSNLPALLRACSLGSSIAGHKNFKGRDAAAYQLVDFSTVHLLCVVAAAAMSNEKKIGMFPWLFFGSECCPRTFALVRGLNSRGPKKTILDNYFGGPNSRKTVRKSLISGRIEVFPPANWNPNFWKKLKELFEHWRCSRQSGNYGCRPLSRCICACPAY